MHTLPRLHWFLSLLLLAPLIAQATEPLPSWNEGPSRQAIVSFVDAVTEAGGKHYVPVAERIAVFDNDGTQWIGEPL